MSGEDVGNVVGVQDLADARLQELLEQLDRTPAVPGCDVSQVASLEEQIREATAWKGEGPKLHPVEHHVAHLASAFLCSPFEEAMCLTVDGFGDFGSFSDAD